MKQAARILHASAYLTRFDAPPPANDAPRPVNPPHIVDAPPPAGDTPQTTEASPAYESPLPLHQQTTPDPLVPEPATVVDPGQLKAEYQTKLETKLAEERARATEALAEARADWIVHEGERLEKQLSQALSAALHGIRDEIARIITPLVQKKIENKTIDALLDDVLKAAENNVRATMEIAGAPDLIARISAVVAPYNITIVSTESEEAGVSVQLDATKLETIMTPALSAILSADREDHGRK